MIKNKLLSFLTITFFISLFPIISFAQNMKPDLIITNVTTRTKTIQGRPSSRTLRDFTIIEYIITVKNVGNANFAKPFYISWKRFPPNQEPEHYSATSLVNYDSNLIPIDGSIDVIIEDIYSWRDKSVKFLIDTDGKPSRGSSLPKIEELNYDNNTYMF
jgi:hypothetical protein